ncbi:MAG: TPM domain-containing protein, partial [Planctomycetaceae bacterium]|nr:TPM domain-containing protein [Planctomycetaceae bacterium]
MERRIATAVLALAIVFGVTGSADAAAGDELLARLQPTADINDFAELLSPADEETLENRCRQLREKTGAQLAVVVLKSLEGGQIDDFGEKLFRKWGIGQADRNNGVLLLVAIKDRKARIEVGYDLEPVLPDALAGRILNEQLFPQFKAGRYFAGLQSAVNR